MRKNTDTDVQRHGLKNTSQPIMDEPSSACLFPASKLHPAKTGGIIWANSLHSEMRNLRRWKICVKLRNQRPQTSGLQRRPLASPPYHAIPAKNWLRTIQIQISNRAFEDNEAASWCSYYKAKWYQLFPYCVCVPQLLWHSALLLKRDSMKM